jgi:hypothetical protein
MLLENPTAEYLLFDLNNHEYTEPCLEYIKSAFPDTVIRAVYGNSVETINTYICEHRDELHTYDLCHIDGGHTPDIFVVDYHNIKSLSKVGSPVIFDDYDINDIRDFIHAMVAEKNIVAHAANRSAKTLYRFLIALQQMKRKAQCRLFPNPR